MRFLPLQYPTTTNTAQPTIIGTLEIRTNSDIPQPISTVQLNFVTIDTLKSKPRDVRGSLRRVNYELTETVNDRIISMDMPFLIGIRTDVAPTSDGARGSTTHWLEVVVNVGKQVRQFEFPVVITTYDTLPLYRQFNEPIAKVVDSKDNKVMIEYSVPTSAVGPGEQLVMNCKVGVNPSHGNGDKIKLKRVSMDLVEIFDCRSDKSFIKEGVVSSVVKEYGQALGLWGLTESLNLKTVDTQDKYKLFMKHQDVKLLQSATEIQRKNDLKPLVIEHLDSPIPFSHHQPMTKRSVLFSTYYELRAHFKMSGAKDVDIVVPITVAPFDRSKSIYLLRWILKESEFADSFIQKMDGKVTYDRRFDTLVYPQRKPSKMTSKEDKQKFI